MSYTAVAVEQPTTLQYKLLRFSYSHRSDRLARATVWIQGELTFRDKAKGVGAVSAVFHAIDQIIYMRDVQLHTYQIHNDQKSIDSRASVYVLLAKEGKGYGAWGYSLDLVEASALAYIAAYNKILLGHHDHTFKT